MSLRPILTWGDPRLEAPNAPVEVFDDALAELIAEMFQISWKAPGLGLAAPQIGVNIRLAVLDLSVGKDAQQKIVVANPEITVSDGRVSVDEGCLSFPGMYTTLERPLNVVVAAQDQNGQKIEVEGETLLAQALCHEIDHLDSVLLINRLRGLKRRMFVRKAKKLRQTGVWDR